MNNYEMDMNFSLPLIGQSHAFLCSNDGNVNRRNWGREETPSAAPPQQQPQILYSMQSPEMLNSFQFQLQTSPVVSTGLHLALVDQQNNQIKREQPDSVTSSFFSELAAQIDKDENEMDQYLIVQAEQIRRTLAERHQRNYRTLLESAGKKLLEKEEEIGRAGRYISELEDQLTRFQTETMKWKVKAMADQATAASLHAQLQKATVAAAAAAAAAQNANENCGESPAEDAESAHVDPNRIEKLERPCRACFIRPAMVVLLPCGHLCLCVSCDFVSTGGDPCPNCGFLRTGSIQISLT